MEYPTNRQINQIKEVREVDSEYECNELLDTGDWIFLNSYFLTHEICDKTFNQEIRYCLGKIK